MATVDTKTTSLVGEISNYLTAPVQISILIVLVLIIRKFFRRQKTVVSEDESPPIQLQPMAKRDFTLAEMAKYNGVDDERILIAINGKVFDVTKGRGFYGPGGPYGVFAGRDTSRCFATFSTDPKTIKDEYDDLSDLNSMQMESLLEWEIQLSDKYDYIGKLLKPGEAPANYNAEESEDEIKSEAEKKVE